MADELRRLGCAADRVLELGCFDGKLIDYLPHRPARYIGYDANWEGGLDLARTRWRDAEFASFHAATTPSDMELGPDDVFDVAVSMETLEHVPPDLVEPYLAKIAEHLDGYLFVTVPVEKGPVLLAKWLAKRILSRDAASYTSAELVNATLGRMHRVARNDDKGFDWEALVAQVGRHFDVVRVEGLPLGRALPAGLCFGVGIVAHSRRR